MSEAPETPIPESQPTFGRIFAPECQIFGCDREMRPSTHVLLKIDDEEVDLYVCAYHADIFTTWDPALYELGFTYRHDVEMRFVPSVPAAEVTPEGGGEVEFEVPEPINPPVDPPE